MVELPAPGLTDVGLKETVTPLGLTGRRQGNWWR